MRAMDGAEIARKLGVTRQAVSNILKKGMEKIYVQLKKDNPEFDGFDIAVQMMIGFDVTCESLKFFRLFPPYIRKEIENDAKKRMPYAKK